MSVIIREAVAGDAAGLHALVIAIAEHHQQRTFVRATAQDLVRDGFGASPLFGALLADDSGTLVGYASYTWNYSIWLGSTYMNIDDVFVQESHRGLRIGEALMEQARALCRQREVHRMRWEVQPDNLAAIRFYERIGAKMRIKGVFGWEF